MAGARVDLTDAERALLERRSIATLGTINEDGSILLTPIWYLFDGDAGRLYVATGSGSHKVRNVAARPQATLLVDERSPERQQWVSAAGPVEIVRGEAARALNARIRARYVSPAGEAAFGSVLEAADDVTLALTPTRWRSWRPEELEQLAAEQGLGEEGVRAWFLPLD